MRYFVDEQVRNSKTGVVINENNNTQNNENCGCKFDESCPRCFNTLTIGGFKCGTEIPGGYDVFKRDL